MVDVVFSNSSSLSDSYLRERVAFIESYFSFSGSPTVLYDYQRRWLLDGLRFRVVNKSRQTGFSWVVAMEALADTLLRSNHTTLIVSTTQEGSKRLMSYVKMFYKGLPLEWQRRIRPVDKSATHFSLANGSKIVSLPNNPGAARGFPADHIILDEFAHLERDDDMYTAILPTITRGGRLSVISTPMGNLNLFFKFFNEAKYSYFSKHLVHWKDCPDFNEDVINGIRKSLSDEQFMQEYECLSDNCLVPTSRGVFNPSKLVIGDEVVTSENKFGRIVGIKRKKCDKRLVAFKTYKDCFVQELTEDHPVLVADGNSVRSNKPRVYWKSIGAVDKSKEYLVFSFNKVVNDFPISNSLLNVIGWYLAEGSIGANSKAVCFSLMKDEPGVYELFNYLTDLGYNPKKYIKRNVCNITVNNVGFVNFMKQFGVGSENKALPREYLLLSPEKQKVILNAYWEGDGCHHKDQFRAGTVSIRLVFQLRDILLRNGIVAGFNKIKAKKTIIEGRLVNCRESYQIVYYGNRGKSKGRRSFIDLDNGRVYLPLKEYSKRYYYNWVYDLQVDDDHTFNLTYNTIHNCKFLDEVTSVFPLKLLELNTDPNINWCSLSGVDRENPISIGVDFGKKHSYTTIHVGQKDGAGVVLKFIKSFKPVHYDNLAEGVVLNQYEEQLVYLKHLVKLLKPVACYVDSTGVGERLFEELRRDLGHVVIGVNFTTPKREKMISLITLSLKDGLLTLPDFPELFEHLHNIKLNTKSSKVKYVTPQDSRDDHVWALGLMLSGLERAPIWWGVR